MQIVISHKVMAFELWIVMAKAFRDNTVVNLTLYSCIDKSLFCLSAADSTSVVLELPLFWKKIQNLAHSLEADL